jgi:hypothetical protein
MTNEQANSQTDSQEIGRAYEQGKASAVKAGLSAKVVADLPSDPEMREHLEENQRQDGYPGSCGGV